ncbi:hypothetical protein [Streptomyces sp. URMC 123]|uniref:hypothetical protein n=1 Tax=Streptomyces sp. URMC 123 TaxID=3423403 RepID=UPI003F1DC277
MSEFAGTSHGVPPMTHGGPAAAPPPAHEAYAFACMRCGYGWEQDYEIEHHVDATGRAFVTYLADGRRVPSPLTRPTCQNCGGHLVRIMRSGQVSSVRTRRPHTLGTVPPAGPVEAPVLLSAPPAPSAAERRAARQAEKAARRAAGSGAAEGGKGAEGAKDHHWHLSDLLHPFQRRQN